MPTKPVCKECGTQLEPIANKNKGYYVGCPNKANHTGEMKKPEPPAPPKEEPKPADPPKAAASKTLFGW